MPRKTPEQQIADLEAKLARAKEQQRKQRTRELIQLGAMLEPLREKLFALTPEQRALFVRSVERNFDRLTTLAPKPHEPQGGPNG